MRASLCIGLAAILLSSAWAWPADRRAKVTPAPGQVFHFAPDSFRYVSCDIEFRDPTDQKWPNFFCGRPAGGTYTYDPAKPAASLSATFDRMLQPRGDQSRKVLGELCKPDQPLPVAFAINSMGPFRTETVEQDSRRGKGVREVEYSDLNATLTVGSRTIAVKPKATFSYAANREGVLERVSIESRFTLKPSDLGLRALPADAVIQVRVTVCGSPNQAAPRKGKR